MTAAAPRKKANGDDAMRPWRIGIRSGSRLSACSSRMAIGSRRSGAGSHAACQARGTRWRRALPASSRSGRCTGPGVAICRLAMAAATWRLSAVAMTTSPDRPVPLPDFAALSGFVDLSDFVGFADFVCFSGFVGLADFDGFASLTLVVSVAVDLFALTIPRPFTSPVERPTYSAGRVRSRASRATVPAWPASATTKPRTT